MTFWERLMLKSFFAVSAFALAVSTIIEPAQAFITRPGCQSPKPDGCLAKCAAVVPSQQFPTMQACINYWAPRNKATQDAVKAARAKAAHERGASR